MMDQYYPIIISKRLKDVRVPECFEAKDFKNPVSLENIEIGKFLIIKEVGNRFCLALKVDTTTIFSFENLLFSKIMDTSAKNCYEVETNIIALRHTQSQAIDNFNGYITDEPCYPDGKMSFEIPVGTFMLDGDKFFIKLSTILPDTGPSRNNDHVVWDFTENKLVNKEISVYEPLIVDIHIKLKGGE